MYYIYGTLKLTEAKIFCSSTNKPKWPQGSIYNFAFISEVIFLWTVLKPQNYGLVCRFNKINNSAVVCGVHD